MKQSFLITLFFLLASCSNLQKEKITPLTSSKNTVDIALSDKDKWTEWADKYDKGRRSKDGWLSLAGLYWLSPGKNTIGSAKDNDHQLPKGMPANYGIITVEDDMVSLEQIENKSAHSSESLSIQQLEVNKTEISYENFKFYIIKREKGFAIRLQDTESEKVLEYTGTKFYPYAKEAAIPAKLVANKEPKKLNIATVYGTVRESDSAGVLEFIYKGQKLRLEAVSYGKDSPMSLMFVDETGQETTYGAGRYLSVDWPIQGDMTTINFNYAYNPPCAITEFATCPLPPRQNRLAVKIEAGEKYNEH